MTEVRAATADQAAFRDALIERGLAGGKITAADVNTLCRRRHPWIVSNALDALLVWSMVHRRDFLPLAAFERTWLAGWPRRACKNWVKSILGRASPANSA